MDVLIALLSIAGMYLIGALIVTLIFWMFPKLSYAAGLSMNPLHPYEGATMIVGLWPFFLVLGLLAVTPVTVLHFVKRALVPKEQRRKYPPTAHYYCSQSGVKLTIKIVDDVPPPKRIIDAIGNCVLERQWGICADVFPPTCRMKSVGDRKVEFTKSGYTAEQEMKDE